MPWTLDTVTHFDTVSLGELIIAVTVAAATIVFGWPAWKLARRSERMATTEDRRRQEAKLAAAVARYLGVPMAERDDGHPATPLDDPSPAHPSVIDLLTEIRDYQQEQSMLALIVAYHLDDGHGNKIPDWVLDEERHRQRQRQPSFERAHAVARPLTGMLDELGREQIVRNVAGRNGFHASNSPSLEAFVSTSVE